MYTGRGVAFALVAALAACSGGGDEGDGAAAPDDRPEPPPWVLDDGVLPFEERPATAPESLGDPEEGAAPPDVPECTAEQVTFEVISGGEVLGNTPGPGVGGPEVRNLALTARPGERCGLSAYPEVRLTSTEGEPDPVVADTVASPEPLAQRLVMSGRQRVVSVLRWRSSCGPEGAEVRVEGRLSGGDVVSAPLADRPACDPAQPNEAGWWMVFPAHPPANPLTVTVEEQEVLRPSLVLRGVVRLDNPGDVAVPLDPCPVYRAGYFIAGDDGGPQAAMTSELNCAEAPGEIPPGGRLRFAVELDVDGVDTSRASFGVIVHLHDGSVAAYSTG